MITLNGSLIFNVLCFDPNKSALHYALLESVSLVYANIIATVSISRHLCPTTRAIHYNLLAAAPLAFTGFISERV